jgi:hypothetical protein
MHEQETDVKPWYRQYWPWYLISIPLLSVIATGIMMAYAINHQDALVVDNYYKQGLAINRTLARQRAAAKLGLEARAQYDAALGMLSIRLHGRRVVTPPKLTLLFAHATLAHRDYQVKLSRQGDGVYRAHLPHLRSGNWDLMLEPEDESWRLDAHLSLPAQRWTLTPEL